MKRMIWILCLIMSPSLLAQDIWRGLTVERENRCSPYKKSQQYPYSQSVEDTIVELMGGRVYGPYTGRYFTTDRETDIEHIVSTSEAHNSGLCSASAEKRKQFASDPLNLTLAAPEVNRCGAGGKCGFDAAEWMPPMNQCWFANRIVEIKTAYELSIDQAEAIKLDSVLANCESVEMIFFPKGGNSHTDAPASNATNALTMFDDNNNGRITCAEARAHGITPVLRAHAAYEFMNDGNNDGVVCR
jgi:hypothetical protein